MSCIWQKAYSELTAFVTGHPEVKIELNRVHIPDDFRPEFYRLFDNVRKTFTEENFSGLIEKATILDRNYNQAGNEVKQLLKLDNISMNSDLLRFLSAPIDQLIRGLYDHLFDLLKGRVDIETFENKAKQNIQTSFPPLYRLGYEKWVILSLVKLLKTDGLFRVVYQEATLYDAHKGGGTLQEQIPTPENTNSISFQYAPNALLMVPDFILHSPQINKCIAFRSQIGEAFGVATGISQKKEYHPLDAAAALHPDGTFICMGNDTSEVSLIADEKRICRPDLIIECWTQKDWNENEELARIKFQHDTLRPNMGTYVVSDEPVPENEQKELGADIHILDVGFDQFRLEIIIDALSKHEEKVI